MDKRNLWLIIENIDSKESAAIGLFEKRDDYTIYMGKLCVKNKFHKMGLSSVLGGHIINHLMEVPGSKSILRFDCDVRADIMPSQKFLEKASAKPYGFIINYNNFTDKRNYDIFSKSPIIDGKLGSVVLYAIYLDNLWKKRNNNIYLINNEDIIYYYNEIVNLNREMYKDNVIMERRASINCESYTISMDFYKAIIKIEGYLLENTLLALLKKYADWNVIEWRIPANEKGLASQEIALKNEFIISGYDPGSIIHDKVEDTILFCFYPRGIDFSQFERLHLTQTNEKIVNKLLSKIKEKNIKKIEQIKKYDGKMDVWKN